MPGPFAHFTLFQKAMETFCYGSQWPKIQEMLGNYSEYGKLGSNSPDFPIVALDSIWEEYLHADFASALIYPALQIIPTYPEEVRPKLITWFLGYLSHMVADAVIHPVVNLKVGPYEGHEKDHQMCEIYQDAFIYPDLGLGSVKKCNFLKHIIASCCHPDNRFLLDPIICEFWKRICATGFSGKEVPFPDFWFAAYTTVVDQVVEESDWFHVRALAWLGEKEHLLQRSPDEIDYSFIDSLVTTSGKIVRYDKIFEIAVQKTVIVWEIFSQALEDFSRLTFPLTAQWNLNTGKIVEPNFIFW
jgi:hypothetical protein